MVTFANMDKHIPDLIADELNNHFAPPNGVVLFAATRRPDREKPLIEMEVHLSTIADVADIIKRAAQSQEQRFMTL